VRHLPLPDEQERASGSLRAQVRFLTERLRAIEHEHGMARAENQRLEAARQAMADLVLAVCHDLRTPLTVIHGALELAARSEASPSEREELLEQARAQVAWMTALSAELVHLVDRDPASPEAGREPLDARAVAAGVCARIAPLARSRDVTLALSGAGGAAQVLAPREDLEHALVNLVGNAVKYAPRGSSIEVRVLPGAPGSWRIEVADRGPGVPAELRTRVFERGFRGPHRSRCGPSSGLGLWIVQSVVRRLGGRVGLESRADGGSVFWVELPGPSS
jgi:signal transduction histidine kinase